MTNSSSFSFRVLNPQGVVVAKGSFLAGVGASFKMADCVLRDRIEQACAYMSAELAAVGVNLTSGYSVEKFFQATPNRAAFFVPELN
jgi:hypothetical protein